MKLEFSRRIFEKSSNIKLHENLSDGEADLFHEDRQTDRCNDNNSRFNNSANEPKHLQEERTCFEDQCCLRNKYRAFLVSVS